MIKLVEAPGFPSHVALAICPPTREERQLMRGMTDEEALLFMVHAQRLVLVQNLAPSP